MQAAAFRTSQMRIVQSVLNKYTLLASHTWEKQTWSNVHTRLLQACARVLETTVLPSHFHCVLSTNV